MPLSDDLERLEKLVLEGGFDDESKQDVRKLRARFEKAVAAEQLAQHPAVAPYIQYLKDEIARCKELLSEDDTLTDPQRVKLFERKRSCQDFLNHFGDTSQIEQTIKQLLDVAKNS
jgi:hypothetical protein